MKGFIYKITSPSTDKIYIGSTTTTLKTRLRKHRHNKLKCSAELIVSLLDSTIELIEEVEIENKKELLGRERYYIELNRDICVNKNIPNREVKETQKEYYMKNINKIKENKANYYKNNSSIIRDKLKQKFNCECGGRYTKNNKVCHLKSKKHEKYISSII